MASPKRFLSLLAALAAAAVCDAGPLGPLPNVTSMDLGLKEGGCALGDVVYMPGDEFPGEGPCEHCSCSGGFVQCARQLCEPRPGCKALHRPDHCCPTYQCECEQEGRVYGNGEKLVDPADPCRVCYCQGGEVVCRRIACFVRDDCTPRRVPGRCCPEYDNCPLRGVTTIPGGAPAVPNIPTYEEINTSVLPSPVKEQIKKEITIKEITPVSEIPVITEVKIKEILPSPSIDVAEYSSSKSPPMPREVTSETSQIIKPENKQESPELTNPDLSLSASSAPLEALEASRPKHEIDSRTKSNDAPPSRISLSTQDSINSNIYMSSVPSAAVSVGSPSMIPHVVSVPSSKTPLIEEEDTSLFDHNPAFPPLPDDLSVLGNHEEEILTEQNMDNEHLSVVPEVVVVANVAATSTEAIVIKDAETTASSFTSAGTTAGTEEISRELSLEGSTTRSENGVIIETTNSRESSMLNLRSVMSTETINLPAHLGSSVELSDATVATAVTTAPSQSNEQISDNPNAHFDDGISSTSTDEPDSELGVADKVIDSSEQLINAEQMTSSVSKVNAGTEVTSQTELSSLPVETSDQNPHDSSENITKGKASTSTVDPLTIDESSTRLWPTDSKINSSEGDNQSFEIMETTEFVSSPFGSQESTTAGVELIKIPSDSEKRSAIVDQSSGRNNNVLTDLINLVGDVASIGDHNEGSDSEHHTASPTTISDSEELIPVNAGYKSKNKSWNSNSITEVPTKIKTIDKQKNVEIEDDDTDSITDQPPPNDRAEPTTRRPLIDNVTDGAADHKTEKKDIEIITQSYVPTISRRPTKVVMKKDRPDDAAGGGGAAPLTADSVTANAAGPDEVAAATGAGGAAQ